MRKEREAMQERNLRHFKNALTDQLDYLITKRARAAEELADSGVRVPDRLDQAAREAGLEFTLRIRAREMRLIQKIRKALNRIDEETFGICAECGEEIALKRLKARPVTTCCIACKSRMEAIEKNNRKRRPSPIECILFVRFAPMPPLLRLFHRTGTPARNPRSPTETPCRSPPARLLGLGRRVRDAMLLDDVLVQDPQTSGSDDPHGNLHIIGDTQFADQKYVQRQIQGGRHFVGHGHPAPRQRQYQCISAAGELLELFRQLPAGIGPVQEDAHVELP
jgi:DnaK suppressor protein